LVKISNMYGYLFLSYNQKKLNRFFQKLVLRKNYNYFQKLLSIMQID